MPTGHRVRREKIKPETLKPCAYCGHPFPTTKDRTRFCSKQCQGMSIREYPGRRQPGSAQRLQKYYTKHQMLQGLAPKLDWLG